MCSSFGERYKKHLISYIAAHYLLPIMAATLEEALTKIARLRRLFRRPTAACTQSTSQVAKQQHGPPSGLSVRAAPPSGEELQADMEEKVRAAQLAIDLVEVRREDERRTKQSW
jgi:hypothetical protein